MKKSITVLFGVVALTGCISVPNRKIPRLKKSIFIML